MHELVHVVQNENGQFDDEERENEAYSLEIYSLQSIHCC